MKKKVTLKDWNKAIHEAKRFVFRADEVRWKIADIALSVCDDSHGGKKKTQFTVSKFAEAIGMEKKTLFDWVRIKRDLINKLPVKMQKEAMNKKGYRDLQMSCAGVDRETTAIEAKSAYMNFFAQTPEEIKFAKYLLNLRSILWNAQRPMTMLEVTAETIKSMVEVLDTTSALFKIELEHRNKYSIKERVTSVNKTRVAAVSGVFE